MKKNSNVRKKIRRLFLLVLCLSLIATNINGLVVSAVETSPITEGKVKYLADNDTSDSYKDLINLRGESRRAGRVWSDKSVFTSDIELDIDTDGYAGTVVNGSDFLHMFSALGSSQELKEFEALDVVFVLDTSASMSSQGEYQFLNNGKKVHEGYDENTNPRLEYAVEALDENIGKLMNSSKYNRVSLVTFNLGAATVLPLDRYDPTTVDRTSTQSGGLHNGEEHYLTIAQASNTRNNGRTGATKNKIDPSLTSDPTAIKPNNTEYDYDSSDYLIAKTKDNDNRFTQQYNTTLESNTEKQRFLDSQGTLDDWKIIEINAVSQTKNTGKKSYIGTRNGSITGNADYHVYWTKDNDGNDLPYVHTSAGTDTYWGIMQGMKVLAEESETTFSLWKDSAGRVYEKDEKPTDGRDLEEIKIQRQPIIVLLTDGAPNPDSSGTKGYPYNWYNGDLSGGSTTKSIIARYDAANGFLVSATAAYQKQFVEQHYYGSIPTNEEDYNTLFYNIGLCMDNPDSNVANTAHDGQVAQAALNPSSFLSNPNKYDYFTTINSWWNSYKGGGTPNIATQSGQTYTMKHPSSNDITSIDYPTEFFSANNPDELPGIFNKILEEIAPSAFKPVTSDDDENTYTNDAGVESALSYMDPIGKYMEVKKVKNVLLFGELYDVTTDGAEKYYNENGGSATSEDYAYSIQNYKIVPKAAGNELINPSYGENSAVKFKLSDIEIYVKTTGNFRENTGTGGIESDIGSDQTLYINIPSNALPIQVATITVGVDKSLIGYTTNIGLLEADADEGEAYDSPEDYIAKKKQSTPLRVFYDVGIASEYKTENNNVDLTKINTQYIKDNSDEDGYVYFYSNWYNRNKSDYSGYVSTPDSTFGDPVLSFTASENNRYYLFEESRLLFKRTNANDTEGGILTSENGKYYLNGEELKLVTDNFDNFDQNGNYYVMIEYYDRYKGLIQYALPRNGGEFGSGVGGAAENEYLCWYNPATGDSKDYTLSREDGYYVAAKKGALRVGDLAAGIGTKDPISSKSRTVEASDTSTGTADTYYVPTVSSSSTEGIATINIYMGNNGVLSVSDVQILVTKTVNTITENEKASDTKFEYTIKLVDKDGKPVTGMRNVVKAVREDIDNGDGTTSTYWRALIDKVELITSNNGLLMGNDGQPALYKDKATGKSYYVYVDGAGADNNNTYTFFDRSNEKHSFTDMLGTGSELTVKAYLVPDSVDTTTWTINDGYDHIDNYFVIGSVNTNTIGFAIEMNYENNVIYYTDEIDFGDNGIAMFTLKDGEGYLFKGLDDDISYTVTEILTDDQVDDGVTLQSVNQKTVDSSGKEKTNIYHKGDFGENSHEFAVSGKTTTSLISEVNYFNYIPNTEKFFLDREEGDYAEIGEEITYVIYWENCAIDITTGEFIAADVTVTDPLDEGVDFVAGSAKFVDEITFAELDPVPDGWTCTNSEGIRTVTWNIKNAPAGAYGYVKLTVKVNEKADEYWNEYEEDATQSGNYDYEVLNRATVRVVNNEHNFNQEINTEIVETPVGTPHKTETSVNGTQVSEDDGNLKKKDDRYFVGPLVQDDDLITYSITYVNYNNKNRANVIVVDKLDPGVRFVSASWNDVTREASGSNINQSDVKIAYDTATHTVTWTIFNVEPSTAGKVTMTVQLDEEIASKEWGYVGDGIEGSELGENPDYKIVNRASVQVTALIGVDTDNDGEPNEYVPDPEPDDPRITETIENPVGTPHKTETKVDGVDVTLKTDEDTGYLVGPWVKDDGQIEYSISYVNYNDTEAEITITDRLDPGVEFVSATWNDVTLDTSKSSIDQDGVKITYDKATHTVTWIISKVAPLTKGNVTMTVQVDEEIASKEWGYVGDGITGSELGEDSDYRILNRASVAVGTYVDADGNGVIDEDEYDDPEYDEPNFTETVENPVGSPHKTETKVADTDVTLKEDKDTGYLVGPRVKDDEQIEYSISYVNYNDTEAEITITDRLDPGVEFVSATWNGVTLNAPDNESEPSNAVKITYDAATHTVKWIISKVAPLSDGKVTMVVQLNEEIASKEWGYTGDGITGPDSASDENFDYKIFNRASVAVGAIVGVDTNDDGDVDEYVPEYDDPSITETIENPVGSEIEFPGAGGMGTTLLYLLGGLLVVNAALWLVIQAKKKRTANQ